MLISSLVFILLTLAAVGYFSLGFSELFFGPHRRDSESSDNSSETKKLGPGVSNFILGGVFLFSAFLVYVYFIF